MTQYSGGDDWVSLAAYNDLRYQHTKALERARRAEEEGARLRAKIAAGLPTVVRINRERDEALERAQKAETQLTEQATEAHDAWQGLVHWRQTAGGFRADRDEARAWALRYGRLYLAAKAERDRLRAALKKHGVHTWACRVVMHGGPEEQCSCGLMAALGHQRPTEEDQ